MIDYSEFTLKYDTKGIEGLYEWIDENYVCTKRGKSPHPYADVLHEWLEGSETQFQLNSLNGDKRWYDLGTLSETFDVKSFRIKPKEPVYEYQYAIVTSVSGNARLEWMTQNEALSKYGNNAYKIE